MRLSAVELDSLRTGRGDAVDTVNTKPATGCPVPVRVRRHDEQHGDRPQAVKSRDVSSCVHPPSVPTSCRAVVGYRPVPTELLISPSLPAVA